MVRFFTLLLIGSIISFHNLSAQTEVWGQVGSDIDGVASEDHLGASISISGDGTIMAVGAPDNDENGTNSGSVSIYKLNGTEWQQLGNIIYGESGDNSGCSVSLSDDGSIVAIGANNGGSWSQYGTVRIYQYNSGSNTWVQLGSNINGEASYDQAGISVSLRADGTEVAIGASDNGGNGYCAGHVRVFIYTSNEWQQIGTDIDGDAAEDYFGSSVSLSDDGTVLAVGAYKNDGFDTDAGQVKIFKYDGTSWNQLGSDIYGKAEYGYAGTSVSISSDGNTVALTSPVEQTPKVFVYSFDGSSWTQLGDDIPGGYNNYFYSHTVSINSDGSIVAVGSPTEDPDNDDSNKGQVCVYEFDSTNKIWTQVSNTIKGESASDGLGNSVSISNDGSIVAAGAPWNDAGNSDITYNCGHAREFQLTTTTKINEISYEDILTYPNPTHDILNISSKSDIKQVVVSNIVGKTVMVKNNVNRDYRLDLSDLRNGIYIITIKTDRGIINKKILKR
ncbi:MAG: T9SS type A sorting domain-containing protein [Chlorobi bacterium]|nr:T9SS type A sorting domain-containing protein [Chlorobiota bacterium]